VFFFFRRLGGLMDVEVAQRKAYLCLPMSHKAQSLTLSEDECWRLKRILESKLVPARVQLRAQVLLGAAEGLSNHELAGRFSVSRPTVMKWRRHYGEHGLDGLLIPRAPSARRVAAIRKELEIVNVSLGSRPGNAYRWTIHGLALCERGGNQLYPCHRDDEAPMSFLIVSIGMNIRCP
jgi:transposase